MYCKNLYRDNKPCSCETEPGSRKPAPTLEEVNKAHDSARNGKAAGPDELPVELLKLGGDSVVKAMHKIIACIWCTGKWPEDWTQSTFIPLYKQERPAVADKPARRLQNVCTVYIRAVGL